MRMFSSGAKRAAFGGNTMMRPPERPLPRSLASPSRLKVSPLAKKAPNDCPAEPVN
jgi:hypothetical protein